MNNKRNTNGKIETGKLGKPKPVRFTEEQRRFIQGKATNGNSFGAVLRDILQRIMETESVSSNLGQ